LNTGKTGLTYAFGPDAKATQAVTSLSLWTAESFSGGQLPEKLWKLTTQQLLAIGWSRLMANCTFHEDIDLDFHEIEPCSRTGFEDLDGYCLEHFQMLYVQPASNEAFEANRRHFDLLIKMNRVEQSLGLRPRPYEHGELHQAGKVKFSRTSIVREKSAQVVSEIAIDDLEDM
jgi:hypothetical protein